MRDNTAIGLGALHADLPRLVEGGFISLSGSLIGRLIQFVAIVVISRALGPHDFGLFAQGLALLTLLATLGHLGLGEGSIKFLKIAGDNESGAVRGVLLQAVGLSAVVGGILSAGLFFGAGMLSEKLFDDPGLAGVLRGFAISLAMTPTFMVLAHSTRATERVQHYTYLDQLIRPVSLLLLFSAFHVLGWGLSGAVAAWNLAVLVGLVAASLVVLRLFREALKRHHRVRFPGLQLLSISIPALVTSFMGVIIFTSDVLVLGIYRGSSEVGHYRAAVQVALLFPIVLHAMNAIFAPMIVRHYKDGKLDVLDELFKIGTKWGLYLVIPGFVVILLGSEAILSGLFGSEYAGAALPLIILAASQVVNVGTGSVGTILLMADRQRALVITATCFGALNVILNFALVPHFGIMGAAVGSATAIVGLFASNVVIARNSLGLWPYDRRIFKIGVAGIISWVSTYLLADVYVGHTAFGPLAFTAVCGVSAFTVFWISMGLFGLDPEDRQSVSAIKDLLLRRSRSAD